MAEILVRAITDIRNEPGSEIDRQSTYKKGFPVVIKDTGHPGWGAKEVPPRFVVVKCPEITRAEIEQWNRNWMKDIDYETLSSNHNTATYQVRVFGKDVSVTGKNILTRTQVEGWLDQWNAVIDSVSSNELIFTIKLWDMIQSEGFWDKDVSQLDFILLDYNAGTGIVQVQVDFSLVDWPMKIVNDRVINRNGEVLSYNHQTKIGTFQIHRSDVIFWFKLNVKKAIKKIYARRMYYFSEVDVDTALEQGGEITLTKNQLLNRINSYLDT